MRKVKNDIKKVFFFFMYKIYVYRKRQNCEWTVKDK